MFTAETSCGLLEGQKEMTRIDGIGFEELLREVHGGILPSDIKILLHLSECVTDASPGECTAMCLQYPVSAKANTSDEAITKLFGYLISYLEACERNRCFAPAWADKAYLIAYDYGEDIKIPLIDSSLESLLMQHFKIAARASLQAIVRLKDVRDFQKKADEHSLRDLFGQAA